MRRWAERLYDYRMAATIVVVLLTAFFAWEVKHLDISTRFSDLYPRNHPYIKILKKSPAFGSPFTVTLVVEVKKGTIYNPKTLEKIQEATSLGDLIPGVDHDQVLSIASRKVKHVEATIGGIQASNLLNGPVPQTADEIAGLREKTRSTAGVIGALVSFQEDAALIQASFIERLTGFKIIFHAVNNIIEKLRDDDHELHAAGQPMPTGWGYSYQRG